MDIGFQSLLTHLIGDYILQNDWMALNKKKSWVPAIIHGFVYTLPFLFITQSINALLVIFLSHVIIDHTNIVSKINQIKNWNFKKYTLLYFKQLGAGLIQKTPYEVVDGYDKERPLFIRIWLIIIQDNTLHLLINYLSILYL